MSFHFESFIEDGQRFLESLTRELSEHGIPIHRFKSDHLCFRVSSLEEYHAYKAALTNHGKLLIEAPIYGRAISTFLLNRPFRIASHEVPLVELPAPKTGSPYSTGFEHAEFVIDEPFETFSSRFPTLTFVEMGRKTINPELCLKLSPSRQAKFHHLALDRVIEMEQAELKIDS